MFTRQQTITLSAPLTTTGTGASTHRSSAQRRSSFAATSPPSSPPPLHSSTLLAPSELDEQLAAADDDTHDNHRRGPSGSTTTATPAKKSAVSIFSVPIAPSLLDDIDASAQRLAAELARLMGGLEARMQAIAAGTRDAVDVQAEAVAALAKEVERGRERVLGIVLAVDELCHDMASAAALAEQIKSIKDSLDWLEQQVDS
ncbi:hypothetical protein DFJ73DRAFT_436395 [Zopfochytrium polystomum]|nr:hypothetical protein DFJ73DRAFT_436395 [Zopfochytrium polystomum]